MDASGAPLRRQLIVQIDGLSRPSLERAISAGYAPRLAQLLSHDGFVLHSVYSGLPSTTPAAQGELFYGRRAAVPAFAFLHDRSSARHMLDPTAANEAQRALEQGRAGLLDGGSSYCNIYTGGAVRSRFCPAGAARTGQGLHRGIAFRLRSLAAYTGVALRSGGMVLGETVRLVRHRFGQSGAPLSTRVKRAMDRVVFCVVLRDSARLAAIDDIRDEMPVVHLNFLGYDVQAHRYGPESAAARRALKGIDRAIASLLNEFRRRAGADATALVYSDHGQEPTTPFRWDAGASIEVLVRDACGAEPADSVAPHTPDEPTVSPSLTEKLLGVGTTSDTDALGRSVTTVESGPIAHVYLGAGFPPGARCSIAERIAAAAPAVAAIVRRSDSSVAGCIGVGCLEPLDRFCAERLVDHPFRGSVSGDLDRLMCHPDAGDIVLLGTGFTEAGVTFTDERGSHAGPGPLETHAFIIADRRLTLDRPSGPLRFENLRDALMADRAARQTT